MHWTSGSSGRTSLGAGAPPHSQVNRSKRRRPMRLDNKVAVVTGSSSGVIGRKHHSVYGAAKAGVNQLTKAAALDYAKQNIRVNAVAPSSVWTGLVPMSKEHPEPPPGVGRPAGIPMDRWGLPREIA